MPALSQTLIFTTGTDANNNPIKSSSITYPPSHSGDIIYYSDKVKGDGYYGGLGLHTVSYAPWPYQPAGPNVSENFSGSILIEASLATDPTDADWFLVAGTEATYNAPNYSNTFTNFSGNFVWIRAKVTINAGVLQAISYNH